jgi:hypothetical protein
MLVALSVLTSSSALVQAAGHAQPNAYILPLEQRHGALRTRSSSSSRNLLGAGKVKVMGR